MKISKTGYGIIFNVLIALVMSMLMSFVLTIVNVGTPPGFWMIWLKSFGVAVLVAIPVSFVAIPLVRRILRVLDVQE